MKRRRRATAPRKEIEMGSQGSEVSGDAGEAQAKEAGRKKAQEQGENQKSEGRAEPRSRTEPLNRITQTDLDSKGRQQPRDATLRTNKAEQEEAGEGKVEPANRITQTDLRSAGERTRSRADERAERQAITADPTRLGFGWDSANVDPNRGKKFIETMNRDPA